MTSIRNFKIRLISTLKNLAIIVLAFISFATIRAQDCENTTSERTILSENFENYNNNSVISKSNLWDLWSYHSDDAVVTTDKNYNGNKSLKVKSEGSYHPDVLFQLGNRTYGKYRLSWKMYVTEHKKAYFTIQHDDYSGNKAYEVFFDEAGKGCLMVAEDKNEMTRFQYPYNKWFSVTQLIDLNNDKVELSINDKVVKSWTFSRDFRSNNTLGAVNFYAKNHNEYYIDTMHFTKLETKTDIFIEKNKRLETTESARTSNATTELMTVFPNTSQGIYLVKMSLEQPESIQIVIFNEIGQAIKQIDLGKTNMINQTFDIAEQTNGVYMVQVIGETMENARRIIKV